jgi:uncharacterized membrane protein YesL
MKYASLALWWGIKEGFFQLGRLILLNLTWLLFCLPVITIPASTIALAYSIKIMVIDETNYSWGIFLEAFKRYFISSWRWFIPSVLMPIIFVYNILFFAVESYTLSVFIQAVNVVMLVIWVFLQTFTLPFVVDQEQPVMRIALLNGIKLLYQKPGLYVLTTMFLVVFFLLSTIIILPILLVSVSMGLFVTTYCLQVFLGRRGSVPEEESNKVYKRPGSV